MGVGTLQRWRHWVVLRVPQTLQRCARSDVAMAFRSKICV